MANRSILLMALLAAIAAAAVTTIVADRGPTVAALERQDERDIADVATERLTEAGPVVGTTDARGVHAWLGIPYANAPTGALRWRAPQPPAPWVETLDAFEPGPACAQPSHLPGDAVGAGPAVIGSESCLTLDVWAPGEDVQVRGRDASQGRPVMVWVNGAAAFTDASGARVDGSTLAASEGVVVVSLRHRLGVLGFFAHPALADPDHALGASGNFATLDVILGLEWVRDHIREFGGDPNNVTLFGDAAGATQVMSMLLAPAARGLFHRAILQGGSVETVASSDLAVSPSGPDAFVAELLLTEGTVASDEEARAFASGLSPAETADYLRRRPVRDVLAAAERLERRHPDGVVARLVRDGLVIPEAPPFERFASAERYNAVPIILGSNRDDAKLELAYDPALVSNVMGRFYRVRDRAHYEELARIASAARRARVVDEPAGVLHAAQGPSVWVYRFDWDEHASAIGTDLRQLLGAGHGLEVPFVFGEFRYQPTHFGHLVFDEANAPGRRDLSAAMMSYWAEFAWTGAPGRGGEGRLPLWQPWDEAGRVPGRFLVLDSAAGGGVRMKAGKVTSGEVLAELDASTELAAADKCEVLRRWRDDAGGVLAPATSRALAERARACFGGPL